MSYHDKVEQGTILARGKFTKVDGEYPEITLEDGKTHRVSLDEWLKSHPSPKVGDKINVIATEWSEHFEQMFFGFSPEGFKPDFSKKEDSDELPIL